MMAAKHVEDNDYWQLTWISFKGGNKEAFAIFYNAHIDRLFQYGQKLCVDVDTIKDAIQEVFLDLYLNREKLKTKPENLKYYLLLSLKRNLIKKLVYKRRFDWENKSREKEIDLEFSAEYQLIEKEQDEETRSSVIQALNQLPQKQREAVYLRYNEALEYSEIAVILGITIESVRKQIYRALKTVRELIDNKPNVILLHFFQKNFQKSVHV